jgi:molecular chaperone Hsp33
MKTLKPEELFELPAQDILHRLYHEEEVRLFDPQAVVFSCDCSKERSANALKNVAKDELLSIVAQEGSIKMNCQFCHQEYSFDSIDVESIHSEHAQLQSLHTEESANDAQKH